MKPCLLSAVLCFPILQLRAQTRESLALATAVFSEIMIAPDRAIPADLMDRAECILIVPHLKRALVVGGRRGGGFMSCRRSDGQGWCSPAAIRIEGGSFGLLPGEAADLLILVMNRQAIQRFTGAKFQLGAVVAGPVGRTAGAPPDPATAPEVLAWARSKWLFSGIPLHGAFLREDQDANRELYGRKIAIGEILGNGGLAPPPTAGRLLAALSRFSSPRAGASGENPK